MNYIFRSVKYLVKLLLLLAAIFFLMRWSGTSTLAAESPEAFLASYFATWRGWLFTAAVVVWCGLYPRIEFVRRGIGGDLGGNKLAIIKALGAGGMTLVRETENELLFRAESPLRRLWWMGDDGVTVSRSATGLEIEGPRRFAMEAQHRIPAYIEREQR